MAMKSEQALSLSTDMFGHCQLFPDSTQFEAMFEPPYAFGLAVATRQLEGCNCGVLVDTL